ncbi:EF-hand domain-containing family member C2 [Octopus bimaculoides]|uniref:EF-hand domain-containing family member C2 n=1 Tax=Octopus bimaculoides TaxID=37653 RepID=UPI0022E4AC2B|nr:EF-hand domain-containing family member C2 [Octopus bimaculoides]
MLLGGLQFEWGVSVAYRTIIQRHRIPKPQPHDKELYTLEDFNVGSVVNFYSKVFKIVDCDPFTYNFLYNNGEKIPKPGTVPKDPYTEYRRTVDEGQKPMRPYQKIDMLKQFLVHDQHVLRFYCLWDDSDAMFGDPHKMVLLYFLSDDTIEIHEDILPNSGRDQISVFIKRGKLPKVPDGLPLHGQKVDRTVLNVFGSMHSKGRYILDNLKTGEPDMSYYHASDLRLGNIINVYSRPFLLCDCDGFTKEYYKTNYGIENFTPIKHTKEVNAPLKMALPPYNGFGSEEDSLSNCRSIIPKVPQKDFLKFMKYDRSGFNSNILRFLAKLKIPVVSADKNRDFIISYYLSDDTISVFEPVIKNSGFVGGKFLERSRMKKHEQKFNTELSKYYLAEDLFVGNTVEFVNHQFLITDIDEYTLRFMETRADQFPTSNIKLILEKIKNSRKIGRNDFLRKFYAKTNGDESSAVVSYLDFSSVLSECQLDLCEHEILVLARHYGNKRNPEDNFERLVSCVREQLKKVNYEDYHKILARFKYEDRSETGYLPASAIRRIMLGQKFPISKDLLDHLLQGFTNEECSIEYEELVSKIDWQAHQLSQIVDGDTNLLNVMKSKVVVDDVAYEQLINALYPDEELQ